MAHHGAILTNTCLKPTTACSLYAPDTGCRLNVFFITFTLVIMLVAVAVLYVPRSASSAGILTSGAVMAYCTYVLLAALQSEPPGDACVRATAGAGASGNDRWIQAVGFVIVLASGASPQKAACAHCMWLLRSGVHACWLSMAGVSQHCTVRRSCM